MSPTTPAPRMPCARPGCDRDVPVSILACPPDWKRLPKVYRDAVTEAWRARHTGEAGAAARHQQARDAAIAWWTRNP